MKKMRLARRMLIAPIAALLLLLTLHSGAEAGIRIGGQVIRMEPEGVDAEKYSKPSWGGGITLIAAPPGAPGFFAGLLGLEVVNMLSQKTEFRDGITGLRVEQQTSQNFFRVYLGGRVGPQGHGFFRPYAGADLALVIYTISTDVVIPDDRDREREIRQKLAEASETAFGYDLHIGLELNFGSRFYTDLGARYLRSFSVPQQLGEGSVEIHPRYFQFYLGAGIQLDIR